MTAVFKREFKACLHNAYGCLFAAAVLLFCGIMVVLQNLLSGYPNLEYALLSGEYVFLLAIPLFVARAAAEDRRGGMELFYRSLPVTTASVVVGKYLAMLSILAIPCAILGVYPLIFSLFGEVNLVGAYVGLLQFFLLGAALLAVSRFVCSLVENPIVGAVLSVVACVALYFMPLLAYIFPASPLVSYFAFLILGLAVAACVYVGTRRLPVTLAVAVLLILPSTLLLVLSKDLITVAFPAFLESLSPFAAFESGTSMGIFRVDSLIRLLTYPPLFLFLTTLWVDGKYRN